MPTRNILVIAVDGLRASALGAYGNTSFPTPALSELAAQSFLFDFCYAPASELSANYCALWQSVHPLRTERFAAHAAPLPDLLAERGYATTLVTDESRLLNLPVTEKFGTVVQLSEAVAQPTSDISQTAMAQLFTKACEVVETPSDDPRLVWLHSRGMTGPWDAPIQLQQLLLDEDDPPPAVDIRPPDFYISDQDDPDTAFRSGVAYAAQVMVLDACWQILQDSVKVASRYAEWLVMLIGVRGMPLGENCQIGGVDPRLGVGQVHVPWLIRFPDGIGRLARTSALVSLLDLLPTILEWNDRALGKSQGGNFDGISALPLVDAASFFWRDVLLCGTATGKRTLRTTGWSFRHEADGGTEGAELFVLPDDRWEANNVAVLCPEIVEGLLSAGKEIAAQIKAGETMPVARCRDSRPTTVDKSSHRER
jgi:hypothetical protein